ncbi:MAG TPA: polysaccharide deacetylase family protein [Rariglobus sp.]|jgi:peptidoglycan/xylan/chitin deacetylase (PgdA/CDA1 family)|nr:polysaccharide deacetylase family protein [Rariglobus sp.]
MLTPTPAWIFARQNGRASCTVFIGCLTLGMVVPKQLTAAEPAPESIRIAAFKDDLAGAISYTFDDGIREQFTIAQPLLDKLGFHATFFVIAGSVSDTEQQADAKKPGGGGTVTWDQIRAALAKGHEIGNHSWSHPNLPKLPPEQLEEQISKADAKIAEETGITPRSFAYPYNAVNDQVRAAVMQNHSGAREFQTAISKHDQNPGRLNAWADKLAADHQWGVTMIHGITVGFDAPLQPGLLESHLDYVKTHHPDLWVDTFGHVSRYIRERQETKLQVLHQTDRSVTFVLDTPLSATLFDEPLTVVISASHVTSATGQMKSGKPITVVLKPNAIQIECRPTPEPIKVTWISK